MNAQETVPNVVENKEARYRVLSRKAAELADSLNNPRINVTEFRDFIEIMKQELSHEQLGTLLGFAGTIVELARSSIVKENESQE